LFVAITIIMNSNRANYFYHQKIEIMVNLWGFLSFFYIVNGVFRYINKYLYLIV
jgi:hypothetical protein